MKRRSLAAALVVAALLACRETSVPPPLTPAAIEIRPASASLYEGDTVRFTATVRDNQGGEMTGVKVTWGSTDNARVTIDSTGLARALLVPSGAQPAVLIIAKYADLQREAPISLVWRPPFNVWPDTNVLFPGMTRTLRARLINSMSGYPSPDIDSITPSSWASTDTTVVMVDGAGQITARATGHAQVVTRHEGRSGAAEVYVTSPPTTPLRFTAVSSAAVDVVHPGTPFTPLYHPRACGLTSDGALYCWGTVLDAPGVTDRCEVSGRSGPARYSIYWFRCSEIPIRVQTDLAFTSLMTTGRTTCAVATTKRVYCWGANRSGELGIGSVDSTVHGITPIASSDEFLSIHGSFCAKRTDGAVFCWGGAFGSAPRAVAGNVTFRTVADAGWCGLATDSTAYCFKSGTAERVGGSARWTAIATGYFRQCALAPSGSVYCGTDLQSLVSGVPLLHSLGSYWDRIVVEFIPEICGLSAEGNLYCPDGAKPVNLGGVKLKRFFGHCGIGTDDKAYCWLRDPLARISTFKQVPGQ